MVNFLLASNPKQYKLRAIQKVKDFFNIDKWQVGQPIVMADLAYQISLTDGVSAVVAPEENNEKGLPILSNDRVNPLYIRIVRADWYWMRMRFGWCVTILI